MVTGGTLSAEEILREGMGKEVKETPEAQAERKEKMQLIHRLTVSLQGVLRG